MDMNKPNTGFLMKKKKKSTYGQIDQLLNRALASGLQKLTKHYIYIINLDQNNNQAVRNTPNEKIKQKNVKRKPLREEANIYFSFVAPRKS